MFKGIVNYNFIYTLISPCKPVRLRKLTQVIHHQPCLQVPGTHLCLLSLHETDHLPFKSTMISEV